MGRGRSLMAPCFVLLLAVLGVVHCTSVDDSKEAKKEVPVIVPIRGHTPHSTALEGLHLFFLPGGGACLKDAEASCNSVLQVCRPGHDCEIQCHADKVPHLSEECAKAHPCAPDVEKYCGDHEAGQLLSCLRHHSHKLSHKCIAAEPCLTKTGSHCPDGRYWAHPSTPSFHKLFPFMNPVSHNQECDCAPHSPCGEHLDHEYCQPCGPGCVGNPLCGIGRYWCEVASDKCQEPGLMPMYPHECFGPYPHHPACAAAIVHREAAEGGKDKHYPKNIEEIVMRRCRMQEELAHSGAKCPPVDLKKMEKKIKASKGRRRKSCSPQPSVSSFVHHFFDRLFHPHFHRSHMPGTAAVAATLHRQEVALSQDQARLEHLQHDLDEVKTAAHRDLRFRNEEGASGYFWLLIAPLCLLAVAALLYVWRAIRRR